MLQATYAKAIERLLASGADEGTVVKNLVAHLKKAGRMKLLPSILVELKSAEAMKKTVEARVEVAHEHDAHAALTAAKEAGINATKTHVNHTLLSGFRAFEKGKLVDQSGKRALLDLYRNITQA